MAARKTDAEQTAAAQESAAQSAQAQEATARANIAAANMGGLPATQAQAHQDARTKALAERAAADREAREAEVRRITAYQQQRGDDVDLLWVLSNRVDDRTVLFERDPRHPGGEAFIGGAAPAHVFRTPEIERLLRDGLLVEVPEPQDGPKKPLATPAIGAGPVAAQPGQPVRLGRVPDPDLFDAGQRASIREAQAEAPAEQRVPAGVVVPPAPASERDTSRG